MLDIHNKLSVQKIIIYLFDINYYVSLYFVKIAQFPFFLLLSVWRHCLSRFSLPVDVIPTVICYANLIWSPAMIGAMVCGLHGVTLWLSNHNLLKVSPTVTGRYNHSLHGTIIRLRLSLDYFVAFILLDWNCFYKR